LFTLVGWWPLWGKKLSDPYNVKLRVWDWLSKFFGPLVKRASSFTLTDFVTEEREREREREKERKRKGGSGDGLRTRQLARRRVEVHEEMRNKCKRRRSAQEK